MSEQIQEIKKAFGEKIIGSESTKKIICETLLSFPKEVINYVTKNVWFVSSFPDAWAFAFNGEELAGKHLVFVSDDLLKESKRQQHWTIAHEVGHIILGHKNSILEEQTEKQTFAQEKEADDFAGYYLQMPPP